MSLTMTKNQHLVTVSMSTNMLTVLNKPIMLRGNMRNVIILIVVVVIVVAPLTKYTTSLVCSRCTHWLSRLSIYDWIWIGRAYLAQISSLKTSLVIFKLIWQIPSNLVALVTVLRHVYIYKMSQISTSSTIQYLLRRLHTRADSTCARRVE
jgi:hypothetical protein